MGQVVSMADLRTSVSNLETEKASMMERIETLRAQKKVKAEEGEPNSVMNEQAERKKVEEDIKTWQGIVARRATIQKAMWDVVANMMPEGQSEAAWKVSRLSYCLRSTSISITFCNQADT